MPITTSSFLHFSNKKVRKAKKEYVTNQAVIFVFFAFYL